MLASAEKASSKVLAGMMDTIDRTKMTSHQPKPKLEENKSPGTNPFENQQRYDWLPFIGRFKRMKIQILRS